MGELDRWAVFTLAVLALGFTGALLAACLVLDGGGEPSPEEQIRRGWASITFDHRPAAVSAMTTEELVDSEDD